MTDVGTRAVALQEAGKLGLKDAISVLQAALAYDNFLNSVQKTPPPTTSAAGAEPAKVTRQPKAAKPAKVEVESNPEDEAAAELTDEDENDDAPAGVAIPVTLDGVKEAVALMLSSNKRKEAVTLLKKFKAASATSVKPKDFAAFIAEAQTIAGPAGDEADLSA